MSTFILHTDCHDRHMCKEASASQIKNVQFQVWENKEQAREITSKIRGSKSSLIIQSGIELENKSGEAMAMMLFYTKYFEYALPPYP